MTKILSFDYYRRSYRVCEHIRKNTYEYSNLGLFILVSSILYYRSKVSTTLTPNPSLTTRIRWNIHCLRLTLWVSLRNRSKKGKFKYSNFYVVKTPPVLLQENKRITIFDWKFYSIRKITLLQWILLRITINTRKNFFLLLKSQIYV